MHCSDLPCAKFAAAAIVTFGSMIFSFFMIAFDKGNSPLTPYYCGLITSSISFWAQPPSYKNNENLESSLNHI